MTDTTAGEGVTLWTEDMERERRLGDYERGFRDGQKALAAQPSAGAQGEADTKYYRVLEAFDRDPTAIEYLSEDGEGGLPSGVYQMARDIERLRALVKQAFCDGHRAGFEACQLDLDQTAEAKWDYSSGNYDLRGVFPLATPAQPDTGEIERLKTGIAEAYQVIASVADAGGLWHHDAVQKALTYFADDSMEGEILPFSIDRPDTGDVAALRDLERLINQSGPVPKGELRAIIAALSKPNAQGAHEDGGA